MPKSKDGLRPRAYCQLEYGSFGGGDDDGPGFELNGDDDFVVAKLSGVRKIDRIQVGYASVATKVDVKRLKYNLWTELES